MFSLFTSRREQESYFTTKFSTNIMKQSLRFLRNKLQIIIIFVDQWFLFANKNREHRRY